jgi:hypothetical protein
MSLNFDIVVTDYDIPDGAYIVSLIPATVHRRLDRASTTVFR